MTGRPLSVCRWRSRRSALTSRMRYVCGSAAAKKIARQLAGAGTNSITTQSPSGAKGVGEGGTEQG